MPASWTLDTLPRPNSAQVRLHALPPKQVAAQRFSGLAGEAEIGRQTAQLEAFLDQHHLTAAAVPALARYDPPWTPWFMRRNEILIDLRPMSAKT